MARREARAGLASPAQGVEDETGPALDELGGNPNGHRDEHPCPRCGGRRPPYRAHRGHRCEFAGEIEALRAEVAGLRAVVKRQAEGGDGTDLAILDIGLKAGRNSVRRSLGLPVG